jgi:hypothetical protein
VVGTRVTESEYARLIAAAAARGETVSSHVRYVLVGDADTAPAPTELEVMVGAPPIADRFGEYDRAARRHFGVPRRDPRTRTAPHGDALSTRRRYIVPMDPGQRERLRELVDHGVPVFKIHPHQQRFLDMIERGERPIMIPARRSSGWPEVFRMAEGLIKEACAPWRRDAEACENGMGC